MYSHLNIYLLSKSYTEYRNEWKSKKNEKKQALNWHRYSLRTVWYRHHQCTMVGGRQTL